MPTYKNESSSRAVIAGASVEIGESVETNLWLSPLPSGITKTSDSPYYNPVIHAEKITSSKTVTVPEGEKRFLLHMYATTADVTIKFNSDSNTPALVLYPGAVWNLRYYERVINDIRVTISGGAVLYIIIEKI